MPIIGAIPNTFTAGDDVTASLLNTNFQFIADQVNTNAGTGSGGGGLTQTEVKTSNYTAVVNDLVRTDSTNAAFTVTLPSAPADGDKVGVLDIANKCSINAVLIAASGGKKVEFDPTGLSVNISGASLTLVYNLYNFNWKLV